MTVRALQARLAALGFDPGRVDGAVGPKTLGAINAALDRLRGAVPPTPVRLPAAEIMSQPCCTEAPIASRNAWKRWEMGCNTTRHEKQKMRLVRLAQLSVIAVRIAGAPGRD